VIAKGVLRGALGESKGAIAKKIADANRIGAAGCYLRIPNSASNGVIVIEANTVKEAKKLCD
jgi:hypothetical protein